MARESYLDYELAKQLDMTVDEVREQGIGAFLLESKDDTSAGRLYSMEEVEAYVMSTHTVLLGGSFDPPTVGHIAFVRFLLDHFDEVWVVPCPTHVFGKKMTPAKTRIEMCHLAFDHISKVSVSDYEIKHGLSGASVDFVTKLLADPMATGRVFYYAIGMDNAHNFHQWVKTNELRSLISFVVVPRSGEEIDVTIGWYNKPPHRLLVPGCPLPLTSSTEVRDIIEHHGDFDRLSKLITVPIFEFVREKKLYGFVL